jgi:hypothetical protein
LAQSKKTNEDLKREKVMLAVVGLQTRPKSRKISIDISSFPLYLEDVSNGQRIERKRPTSNAAS